MVGGTDKYPTIIGRGVLLDIAGLHGVDCLPDTYEVTPDDLKKAASEQKWSSSAAATSCACAWAG